MDKPDALPPATRDLRHEYHGYWTPGAVCRIRIYQQQAGQAPVVIATELPENTNTSITNLAEQVAAEVIGRYLGGRQPVWVEHYPKRARHAETFDLVSFADYTLRPQSVMGRQVSVRIGRPSWRRLPRDEVLGLVWGVLTTV